MTSFEVAPLRPDDRGEWETLARGYHTFYEEQVSADVYERVWTSLTMNRDVHAFGAYADGHLVGIVHFLFHGHVWQQAVCYLQDLFVAEGARRSGAARALIARVEEEARRRGAFRVYWMTRHDNETARRLYDKVAIHSGFIRYEDAL